MRKSIYFYKGIFFHVISVRVIVPWFNIAVRFQTWVHEMSEKTAVSNYYNFKQFTTRVVFEYDLAFSHLKQLGFFINVYGLHKFCDRIFCFRNIV